MTMTPMALVSLRKDLTNDEFNTAAKAVKCVRGVTSCAPQENKQTGEKSLTITFDGSIMTKLRVFAVKDVVFVQQPHI